MQMFSFYLSKVIQVAHQLLMLWVGYHPLIFRLIYYPSILLQIPDEGRLVFMEGILSVHNEFLRLTYDEKIYLEEKN